MDQDEVRSTIPIPLERILERPGFNVRPALRNIDKLADTIRTHGVFYPPLVVRAMDREPISETEFYYYVINGHRRIWAMRSLGRTSGQFFVAPPDISLADQLTLNLAENIREDISKAEIADQCFKIIEAAKRDGKIISSNDLAPSIGFSASHLRKYLQLKRDLSPELWAKMVLLRNRAPISKLLDVSRLPHHEQLDAWMVAEKAIKEAAAEEGDEDGEEGERKKDPPKDPPPHKKPSWRSIAAELVKAAPPEFASGARWLLGELGARLGRDDILRGLSE